MPSVSAGIFFYASYRTNVLLITWEKYIMFVTEYIFGNRIYWWTTNVSQILLQTSECTLSKDQAYIDKMLAKYYYQWKDWAKLGKQALNELGP